MKMRPRGPLRPLVADRINWRMSGRRFTRGLRRAAEHEAGMMNALDVLAVSIARGHYLLFHEPRSTPWWVRYSN